MRCHNCFRTNIFKAKKWTWIFYRPSSLGDHYVSCPRQHWAHCECTSTVVIDTHALCPESNWPAGTEAAWTDVDTAWFQPTDEVGQREWIKHVVGKMLGSRVWTVVVSDALRTIEIIEAVWLSPSGLGSIFFTYNYRSVSLRMDLRVAVRSSPSKQGNSGLLVNFVGGLGSIFFTCDYGLFPESQGGDTIEALKTG